MTNDNNNTNHNYTITYYNLGLHRGGVLPDLLREGPGDLAGETRAARSLSLSLYIYIYI